MQEKLQQLLQDLLNGELNETGRQQLLSYLDTQSGADVFAALLDQQLLSNTFALTGELPETERRFINSVLIKSGITTGLPEVAATNTPASMAPVHRIHFMRRWGWVAAAAAVLLIVAGTYFFNTGQQPGQLVATTKNKDIAPGKEGAILTLADGSQVVLDSMKHGVIADQNGSKAVLDSGQLSYVAQAKDTGTIAYNTMSTPRGRQFRVTLPDGTEVWLNAASSIKYPVQFTGSERKVFITGEVYFDVAQNSKMPFRIDVNNKATVEVLGTRFNVNAYDDEPDIRTTLESGSVKVMMGSATAILKPGQQASIATDGAIQLIEEPDMEATLSWKTNSFDFNFAKLDAVFRQLSRWYDIEVIYENNKVPNMEFRGGIEKELSLSATLRLFEKMGVRFRVEGRKLIVLP